MDFDSIGGKSVKYRHLCCRRLFPLHSYHSLHGLFQPYFRSPVVVESSSESTLSDFLTQPMPTAWPEKDDNELLSLIQNGSSQAFTILVERHTQRFYRL